MGDWGDGKVVRRNGRAWTGMGQKWGSNLESGGGNVCFG